jgi:hypothetical protein
MRRSLVHATSTIQYYVVVVVVLPSLNISYMAGSTHVAGSAI